MTDRIRRFYNETFERIFVFSAGLASGVLLASAVVLATLVFGGNLD